jgi:V/A-type H+-transporting ATPase subunit I
MTRVFIAGPADSREQTLRLLQGLGVLHLEPAAEMAGEFEKLNATLLARVKKLDLVIKAIRRYRGVKEALTADVADEDLVPYAEAKLSEIQEVESRTAALERLRGDLSLWGNFDLGTVRALEAAGLCIRRYRMDAGKWEKFRPPDDLLLEVVAEKQGVLFYTVSTGTPPDIPQASALPWPELSLEEANKELRGLSERMHRLSAELSGVAARAEVMKTQMVAALNEATYTGHMATLHTEPYLYGLQGWIPSEQEAAFLEKVQASGLPLRIVTREPLDDEEPPILLKNNWFIERIEPLLKLYKLPKYRDLDPSYFFAPFMILFFGLCLGDVGYGVAFYIISHFIDRKLGDKVEGLPLVMKLCKAFSISAILVGVITGSVFGYNFENRSWILLDVSPGVGDPMLFFYLALGMGVTQLSVCYLLAAFQEPTWLMKFQKLGLLGVLWGGVTLIARSIWFAAPSSALNQPLYYFGVGCAALGVLLTLFFASDHKNWFLRIGLGLWNVYGLTGIVADLLSYARLFGLGIATGAIASVMNQLALMVFQAAGPVIGGVIGFLIIIVGHTFNLLLSILGSTVHSARLHFVEAFKIFFEGGGLPYKPFRIEKG